MTWDSNIRNVQKTWLLYNALSGEEKGPYSENEARAEIRRFSAGTLSDWFAWTEGLSDWKAINEISELRPSVLPPPRPRLGATMVSTITKVLEKQEVMIPEILETNLVQEKTRDLSWQELAPEPSVKVNSYEISSNRADTKASEKRKHPRVPIKLKVVLISNDKTFRTFTKDVSLGGLKLLAEVPHEFLSNDCIVLISKVDDSENLMFEALPVLSQAKNGTRLKFDGEPKAYIERLRKWIDLYPKAQAA